MSPVKPPIFSHAPRIEHGGKIRRKRRKLARPINLACALHVVLRSERARGVWSFLHRRNRYKIECFIYEAAQKMGIRVDRAANVGNHLHLLVRLKSKKREDLANYLRLLTRLIACKVTGARKGHPLKGRFWKGLAYSRVVSRGRDFATVAAYVLKNKLEGFGVIDRKGADADLKIISMSLMNAGLSPPAPFR